MLIEMVGHHLQETTEEAIDKAHEATRSLGALSLLLAGRASGGAGRDGGAASASAIISDGVAAEGSGGLAINGGGRARIGELGCREGIGSWRGLMVSLRFQYWHGEDSTLTSSAGGRVILAAGGDKISGASTGGCFLWSVMFH